MKMFPSLHEPALCRSVGLTVAAMLAVCPVLPSFAQTPPTPSSVTTESSGLIQPSDIPPRLSPYFQAMGSRMTSSATAQITLTGTTTDSSGSRSAQIVVQYPGYISYREGTGTAITFDGTQFQTNTGSVTSAQEPIMESLMAHLPDSIFLQAVAGGALRRVGGHFRPAAGATNYSGSTWTLFAFTPNARPALTAGSALQQNLFIAFDERTGLISEVRIVTASASSSPSVIETQFSNWSQQGGQWFPGQIIRLQNGSQTLSFVVATAGAGQALAATAFQP